VANRRFFLIAATGKISEGENASMKKTSATPALRRRWDHLSEMAARGTEHEKTIAKEKLGRLEARHDFSRPAARDAGDIFAGWPRPAPSQVAHPVLKVKKEWLDAANLIKWVFQDKFHTASTWRTAAAETELLLNANASDARKFKPFAKDLLGTIIAACEEFSRGCNIRELDRAPFLTGLYDGLIDERRTVGTRMPGFSPAAKKKPARVKKLKKNQQQAARTATIHPYDLGRDAGEKLRINIPRDELCEAIRLAVAAPKQD